VYLSVFLKDEVRSETTFAEDVGEHVASGVRWIERLSTPWRGFQQREQLRERTKGFIRNRLDLLLGDRVKVQPVHLPTALTLSENLAPRSPPRLRVASFDLYGARMHPAAPIRVTHRVTGRDPPTVHEVVQDTQIEIHPDLIEHCFETGIEGFTILRHDQGGPDGAKTLGRLGRAARDVVV
jgi:hypothetical protein